MKVNKAFAILALFAFLATNALADHRLPDQPKAADGSYIVKWDCATNDFAASNDMEYDETFVFAVNLHNTPLGEWLQGTPTSGMVRSVAFDKFRDQKEGIEYNDWAARLWHLRDTIYGAVFNFKQLSYQNGGTNNNPALGAATKIAARLFGFETGFGAKCEAAGSNRTGKWWQWSNNSSGWQSGDCWTENTYTSRNDQYLFAFAPYTGTKTSPVFNTSADDPRDRYYDKDHYVTTNGYGVPCAQEWPIDYALEGTHTALCLNKNEKATIMLVGSEQGYNYQLYLNNAPISATTQLGTGAALQWQVSQIGRYSVYATPIGNGKHADYMGDCSNKRYVTITEATDCTDPEPPLPTCAETQYAAQEKITICDTLLPYSWRGKTFSKPGTYYDTLHAEIPLPPSSSVSPNVILCDSVIYTLLLDTVHCERVELPCENLIYRKWNDLLFVSNADNRFVAYQWYCNNQPIEGATKQYLYTTGVTLHNDNNAYHCVVTCTDGTRLALCADIFSNFPASAEENALTPGVMSISPNPSRAGAAITISGIGEQISCRIYTSLGMLVYRFEGTMFTASLPIGCYLLQATDADGNNYCHKLIIQ